MNDYGNGPSTGLDQTAIGKIITGFTPEDVEISAGDRVVLRALAERVVIIAETPEMNEGRDLWRRHNSLEKTRPVIFCDPENGWNEIITEAQMKCVGKLARRWEMDLRKEIFWGEAMGDDKPVTRFFDVPYTVSPDYWGVEAVYHSSGQSDGARSWDAPIEDYERDLPKIRGPEFEIDWVTTNGSLELARQIFSGILDVRLKGTWWWWSLGVTLPAATLRGLRNIFTDVFDHPEELKSLLSMISNGHMRKLDFLERSGLLSLNNDATYVGSGGFGVTDELPGIDFNGKVRCRDMWGFTDSQETVCMSPEMYEEYVFPYEKPLMDRFGLTCYGCCEPLESRWHVVKRHHNLRRVSCSPWADYRKMAENLSQDYVFSMKPNPAALAVSDINWERIRAELRRDLDVTRGCVVEVLMKDNHTLACRPENVTEWCRIAKEESLRMGE